MMKYLLFALTLVAALAPGQFAGASPDLTATTAPAGSIWLDTLDLSKIEQDWGKPGKCQSVENHPLTLGKTVYAHGIGTHARSIMRIDLHGSATHFDAVVGVDDEVGKRGSVTFEVLADKKNVFETQVVRGGDAPVPVSVDLTGVQSLSLIVDDGRDGIDSDHADWAGALLTLAADAGNRPQMVPSPQNAPGPADPPRMAFEPVSPLPAIHGASVVGSTPGKPFLFLIPATGDAPLTYSVTKLPAGLVLDPKTGILSGRLKSSGVTVVKVTVKNARGSATRNLRIIGGTGKLAQTPPMGWNSWNVWAGKITQDKVEAAADAMVNSGLAAHGYQYVNIDDTWEGQRDAQGRVTSNAKFPDMTGLANYVHQKGLKIGIYSSPGPQTCARYEGSYQHEELDAQTYADWGFDYLKYDWCSYGDVVKGQSGPDVFKKPYAVMGKALAKASRDIVFSFCQYGMGEVWTWGESLGGNCWRTTGDINDSWPSLRKIYQSQNGHEAYAGPGHWNDPDMLVVGQVGWGRPHPSHLSPNEQLLHMSLWCLLSSPLLIGCDMSNLDDFTKALLTNDEALDINQDPLGKPAGRIAMDGDVEVWARPLADGTWAVGLVNPLLEATDGTLQLSALKLKGAQPIRDLWLHKDLGEISGSYTVSVPAHGIVLLKVGKPR
ncbi:MAG: NPCBM/NEW2 domain-containing protein [Capsulimonadaceae bacterium]|nr:NPCBM/NEW2 domain-containing protein [Capsulimonadaceae bacterium]